MNDIRSLDGYAHLVRGKVICFDNTVYDLTKDIDRMDLVDFADTLFKGALDWPAYGDVTACILLAGGLVNGRREVIVSQCHFGDLSKDAQMILRSEGIWRS